MSIMVGEAVLVSFAGLIFRSMEHANIWQISFYRGLVLIGTISLILFYNIIQKYFPISSELEPLDLLPAH